MNSDGSGVTRLTEHPGYDWGPDWSPDGQLIAFASERNGDSDIYVMNADGSGVTQLTNHPEFDVVSSLVRQWGTNSVFLYP